MIEALISLAIVSMVLLLGLTALGVQQKSRRALALRELAHREVENALESVRRQGVVLATGPLQWTVAPPPGGDPAIRLWLEVVPTATPGLLAVAVTASWQVSPGGEWKDMRVDSMVFRPELVPGSFGDDPSTLSRELGG